MRRPHRAAHLLIVLPALLIAMALCTLALLMAEVPR